MIDEFDQKLDELLRREFPGAVSDDGFTARVMQILPARTPRRKWFMPAACIGGLLLTWLALLPSGLWQEVAREWLSAGVGPSSVLTLALLLFMGLLGCVWALDEAT